MSEFSSLCLVYVAVQAGLSLTWLQTPKTGFLVMRLKCKMYLSNTHRVRKVNMGINSDYSNDQKLGIV